jgi:hypothetical protein
LSAQFKVLDALILYYLKYSDVTFNDELRVFDKAKLSGYLTSLITYKYDSELFFEIM